MPASPAPASNQVGKPEVSPRGGLFDLLPAADDEPRAIRLEPTTWDRMAAAGITADDITELVELLLDGQLLRKSN